MFGLATLLEALAGPLLKVLVVPAMALALLTTTHKLIKDRDDRLRRDGEMACMHKHELAGLKAEKNVALAQASAARQEARSTAVLLEEMRINVEKSRMETAEWKDRADTAVDDNCIPDGLRERARSGAAGGNAAR